MTRVDAAARVLVYIGKAHHRIEESTFEALRKLLLAHPEVSPAEFMAAVREQWAILAVDERAAMEALPQLLPADATARRAFSDLIEATVAATGKLKPEGQRRLRQVLHLLAAERVNAHLREAGKLPNEAHIVRHLQERSRLI